ncbi:hypothetical protein K435DRAFT_864828 [Dendrothele bispora CBS 962.96]|uniref:Uncharacterized protein n=1 Tax=Dendrothele bispora (strain CBS 962.96) TaxID=1314807 RepID=A0A4S8LLE6_DENBC|nr:hypothetical protein K435DRAFT_864828 [Dendrothele bispora CBS 962.96]
MADLDELVKDVLQAKDFKTEDLDEFSSKNVSRDMDKWLRPNFHLPAEDGWIEALVDISLPAEGIKCVESEAPRLTVDCAFYQKPLEQHKGLNENESSAHQDTCLHYELYNSDAYLQEYERIQIQQRQCQLNDPVLKEEGDIENVPVGIMCWSDKTQVTQFGNQLMWPIYMYFGNQSKYKHAKPTSFAALYLAYIPKLPSNQDFYQETFGFPASSSTLTYLNFEARVNTGDMGFDT